MKQEEQSLTLKNKRALIWLLAILATALFVRVIGLSNMPFTATDASLAGDALAIARSGQLGQSALPAYTGITGALFYVLGSSNFIARLVPVLAGVSLVLASFLFVKRFDFRVAVIFAFALALDPFMVAMSRQLLSPLIALSGLVWAIYLIEKKKPIIAGIFLAIAFLGGYYFWIYALAFFALWGIGKILKWTLLKEHLNVMKDKTVWLPLFISFLISLVFISSGFLLKLSGLGQIGSGLLAFLALFAQPYHLPIYHVFYVLFGLAFLPLLGAVIDLLRKPKENTPHPQAILLWFLLVAFVLTVFFSRKDMGAAVLLILPLWYLCAEWLADLRVNIREKPALKIAAIALFFVLFVYIGMALARLTDFEMENPVFIQVALASVAGVLIVLILFWLISIAFETKLAISLFLSALVLVLAGGMISKTFNGLDKASEQTQLSLSQGPIVLSNSAQLQALAPFQDYGKINFIETSMYVDGIDLDLRWHTKDFHTKKPGKDPEFLITYHDTIPNYVEPYRGMRIQLTKNVAWHHTAFGDYIKSAFKPISHWEIDTAYLWAQTKLFSGGTQ